MHSGVNAAISHLWLQQVAIIIHSNRNDKDHTSTAPGDAPAHGTGNGNGSNDMISLSLLNWEHDTGLSRFQHGALAQYNKLKLVSPRLTAFASVASESMVHTHGTTSKSMRCGDDGHDMAVLTKPWTYPVGIICAMTHMVTGFIQHHLRNITTLTIASFDVKVGKNKTPLSQLIPTHVTRLVIEFMMASDLTMIPDWIIDLQSDLCDGLMIGPADSDRDRTTATATVITMT